jgi:threonine synthase
MTSRGKGFMLQFVSTRGAEAGPYSDVLLAGLAADNGLAVPAKLPTVAAETLEQWRDLRYHELAAEIIGLFATDIAPDDLERLCAAAYTSTKFHTDDIVPLQPLGGMTLVGLSEGPTLAFKDIAMQFLGQAIDFTLEKRNQKLNILGATSGDTGSAAEYAFRGRSRVNVFMLSPAGRMSRFQRAQMYSLQDANIHNITVDGVFDDCQRLVKQLSSNVKFKKTHHLGAVNSINFGRIAAQIVYYFWAWLRASDPLHASERASFKVSFAVPSGNFGNILSGHYARSMGLPIHRLILATNENNVLDEFFRTGVYRPRAPEDTFETSSPSMDVSNASNLERFVYDLLGGDSARVCELWESLSTNGSFDLSAHQPRFENEFGILSGVSTHDDRIRTISRVLTDTGILIDPHTADGVKVAEACAGIDSPILVLETAKPAKFSDVIRAAVGNVPPLTREQQTMLDAPQRFSAIQNDSAELMSLIATSTQSTSATLR